MNSLNQEASLTSRQWYNNLMLVFGFLRWWYGPGWRDMANRVLKRARRTYSNFSISTLLRTLFLPWRRIITPPGGSLGERVRALADNMVSRGVGFSIRIIALLTAIIMIVFTLIAGAVMVLIWPFLPPLSLLLMVGGLAL